jgi:lysophospholipase
MDALASLRARPSAASLALALEDVWAGGARVRFGHWRHPVAERGTVVVLPGRAEFIEKYHETLTDLGARGFSVAILDWRGQGGSDRLLQQRDRGHVASVDDYLLDLAAVIGRLDALAMAQPYLMLAHSMGGHIGVRYLRQEPTRFAGAALSAPMFGIRLTPTPAPVARALCAAAIRIGAGTRYAPGQRDVDLNRYVFTRNRLTSSPDRYAAFRRCVEAAPELALGGVTYGWLGAALRSIAVTRRPGYLESIRTPVLILQAGRERLVSNRAQVLAARRLPDARLVRFPDARHELLLERDEIRDRVLAAFLDFASEVTRSGAPRPAG